MEDGAVEVEEYENPQSDYTTKGISLVEDAAIVRKCWPSATLHSHPAGPVRKPPAIDIDTLHEHLAT